MNGHRELETIGTAAIDGHRVEFLASRAVAFVTAQFAEGNPRGIANLVDLHTAKPRVVPLSHAAWIGIEDREQRLIDAAREALCNREISLPDAAGRGDPIGVLRFTTANSNDNADTPMNRAPVQAVRARY